MAEFPLCPACQAEYEDPEDRRFHAQPVACPVCGPQLRLLDAQGRLLAELDAALRTAANAIRNGQVLALQGIGGFQLLVDAMDAAAVDRLRRRKHRPDRPFALMFPALDAVRQCCQVSDTEARELMSPAAPILLLRRRLDVPSPDKESRGVAANVAPGNPYLGVMLPYTPLHHLLMQDVDLPLVCTSGNLSEEPMATDIDDALHRLGGLGLPASHGGWDGQEGLAAEPIADAFLVHNRPIVRPVDDSVVRVGPNGLQVLRRARGFAPLPIKLPFDVPPILAVGGHLKNTVGLAISGKPSASVVLSQHIGDLESPLSLNAFRRAIDDLLDFFAVTPQAVACDLHPDYASTRYAEELSARFRAPLIRVQHHHAHVAACMAEHGLTGPVLGFSWDGTGYGDDGTIWGGEALFCEGAKYRRAAHLRTFPLPGGDAAARQPRRSALGLLCEILGLQVFEDRWAKDLAAMSGGWFSPSEQRVLAGMLGGRINCPRTSSMGRLFDAMAALCGLGEETTFEGQAAMKLEFAADALGPVPPARESYRIPLQASKSGLVADWEPMVRQAVADRLKGTSAVQVSARFHNALADLALEIARGVGQARTILTGGCFQNALLTELVRGRLLEGGFEVFEHRQIPPGDGGIALGQIFVAAGNAQGPSDVSGNTR